jgi:ribosomal protein RSM22 (predicted rRNA methylase)
VSWREYTDSVTVPSLLQAGIDRELARVDHRTLARAVEQITTAYNAGRFEGSLSSSESRAAYLITRLPATYAANSHVLREAAQRMNNFRPTSFLDLGAGPGAGGWAASEVWPTLQEFTCIESNSPMTNIGKSLANGHEVLGKATWHVEDLQSASFANADVVLLSYSIGELLEVFSVVRRAWEATKRLLVLIEPGTPKNFGVLARMRESLINNGAHIVSPCPHANQCPMYAAGDWCHFSTRLERTSEHRRLKGGTLGYEDEKFSYIAVSKQPEHAASARIVRHPQIGGGHIRLSLCTAGGLKQETVTRSKKEAFRAARKASWGDEWSQFE